MTEIDIDKLFTETRVTLADGEEKYYRYVCITAGIDPDARLSDTGKHLSLTPFHYAQLIRLCANISAKSLEQSDVEGLQLTATEVVDNLDNLMRKSANRLKQQDLSEEAFDFITLVEHEYGEPSTNDADNLPEPLEPRYPLDE